MTIKQLNVEISEDELQKTKKDAIDMGVSLTTYTTTALRRFRQEKTKDQRRACFTKNDMKVAGRKLVVS